MTEASAAVPLSGPAEFLRIWSESLAQVLGQITGRTIACAVLTGAPVGLLPAADNDLWTVVACSAGLRGEMTLRLTAASAIRLAQIFTGEAVTETQAPGQSGENPPAQAPSGEASPAAAQTPVEQLSADQREAVVELLRQVAGIVSTSAKARWGELQLRAEAAAAAPSWPAAATFWIEPEEGLAKFTLEFGLSAALVAELRAEKAELPQAAAPQVTADSAKSSAAPIPPGELAPEPGALNLLMDVQLAMTLRFGAKTLLLRDVLDLSPGSVVELNRKVQEPVDLLLEGRLVARGDLVVIDGNYGLRVTDVSALNAGEPAR